MMNDGIVAVVTSLAVGNERAHATATSFIRHFTTAAAFAEPAEQALFNRVAYGRETVSGGV